MTEDQKLELALALFETYLETKSPAVLTKFWKLYPKPIPSWHLLMMNDQTRNEFYEKEIKAQAQNKIVLDLGAGAGLLTNYALEAGAKHVYCVEQDPILQRCLSHAFKSEIQSGRVTLIAKNSKDLVSTDFVAGTPELIVHEIFGNRLLNEMVLEVFTDLYARGIVNTSMNFIPEKFSLWGTLRGEKFESSILDQRFTDKYWFLKDISFFGTPILTATPESKTSDLSEGFEIFSFDMKDLSPSVEVEKEITSFSKGNAVRIWFKLHGEHSTLTTDINVNPSNHWKNSTFYLSFPEGEIKLKALYKDKRFLVYL